MFNPFIKHVYQISTIIILYWIFFQLGIYFNTKLEKIGMCSLSSGKVTKDKKWRVVK